MSLISQLAGLGAAVHRAYQTETITHYPLGDLDAGVDVAALVDWSQPLGSNEMTGDGAVTSDEHGDRERQTCHIEVPADLVVVPKKDLWRIDGVLFTTQRGEGRDTGAAANFRGYRVTAVEPARDSMPRLKEGRRLRR